MNLFYDHLTGIDVVRAELESSLSPAEIEEVITIIDTAIHHTVMRVVLTELPSEEHDDFMARFSADPASGEHLAFLQQFNPNIAEVIRRASFEENQRFLDTIHHTT